MRRPELRILALAVALSGVRLVAQPSARKDVYIGGLAAAAPAASAAPAAETDYESFIRTFLTVRLQQSKRLQVRQEGEPPCSPSAPAPAAGGAASVDRPAQTKVQPAPPYFLVKANVQQRRDAANRIFDIVVHYDVVRMENCHSVPLAGASDTVSFPPANAFGHIRVFVEAVASRLEQEAAEKISIYLDPGEIQRDIFAAYSRAVRYALADADDYRIALSSDPGSAMYTVDSVLNVTASKKGEGKVDFDIGIRGQPKNLLPKESHAYRSDAELTRLYLDAGAAIANAVSELRNRELARIEGDPAQLTAAVVLRRVNLLLCTDVEPDKECDRQPEMALTLLNGLDSSVRAQADTLYLLGEAGFWNQRYREAAQNLDAAFDKLPRNELQQRIKTRARAAEAWSKAGEFQTAAARYQAVIEFRQTNKAALPAALWPQADEYAALASCYRETKQFDRALDAWLSAAPLAHDAADLGVQLDPILDGLTGEALENAFKKLAAVPNIDPKYLSHGHERLAQYYSDQKRFMDAARQYAEVYESLLGSSNKDEHAICLAANNAAIAYGQAGAYEDELKYNKLALDHGRKFWGPADNVSSDLARNVGYSYLRAGKPDEAEKVIREFVDVLSKDPKAPETAFVPDLYLLATALADQHNYAEAERVYGEIAGRQRRVHGEESKEYGAALENRADMYDDWSQSDKAQADYEKARDIYKVVYPPEDPMLAKVLNNLGVVQWGRSDFAGARNSQQQALEIFKRRSDWTSTLVALTNVAETSSWLGDTAVALERANQALDLAHQHGDQPYWAGEAWTSLGNALDLSGRYAEAAAGFRKARGFYEQVEARERWRVWDSLDGLAGLDLMRGEYSNADDELKQAADLVVQRWGQPNWREAILAADRGSVALARKQLPEALADCDRADKTIRASLPDNRWLQFLVQQVRAEIALESGDLGAAERLARAAYSAARDTFTESSPFTFGARIRVARVLERKGDLKEAGQLLDEKALSAPQVAEHHWLLGEYHHVLALVASHDPARSQEAREHFAKAKEIYSDWGGAGCPRVAELLRDQARVAGRSSR